MARTRRSECCARRVETAGVGSRTPGPGRARRWLMRITAGAVGAVVLRPCKRGARAGARPDRGRRRGGVSGAGSTRRASGRGCFRRGGRRWNMHRRTLTGGTLTGAPDRRHVDRGHGHGRHVDRRHADWRQVDFWRVHFRRLDSGRRHGRSRELNAPNDRGVDVERRMRCGRGCRQGSERDGARDEERAREKPAP